MVERQHRNQVEVTWKATPETGTRNYRSYSRDHRVYAAGKIAEIPGSSIPMFHGDGSRYNPEELLIASLSSCHLLWVLHLCATAGIVVTEYTDSASGVMREEPGKGGRVTEVTLHPRMLITDPSRIEDARSLHARAHEFCYIASSVNFPVTIEPEVAARDHTTDERETSPTEQSSSMESLNSDAPTARYP